MSMGENIRFHRKRMKMTQEELGQRIGVQKSAVRKYEKGEVENIKRSTIKKMADIFDISPCELMDWDEEYNQDGKLQKEVSLIELIQSTYGKDTLEIVQAYLSLNDVGKEKALENVLDLTAIPKYTEKEKRESAKMA